MPAPEMRACLISWKIYSKLMWLIENGKLEPVEVVTFPDSQRLDPRFTTIPTDVVARGRSHAAAATGPVSLGNEMAGLTVSGADFASTFWALRIARRRCATSSDAAHP